MDLGFGEALLLFGLLLSVAAALSGFMHGTVLSVSVLSVGLGVALALADVVTVDVSDPNVIHLVELALILTLFADGLVVERELLRMHWGPPARAIVFAMPITLGILAVIGLVLFPELAVAEAFLLAAVLTPTDPVVTSSVVTSKSVPERVRHTLNLESGLNDGLALPFDLVLPGPRNAGRRRGLGSGQAPGRGGGRSGDRRCARDRGRLVPSPCAGWRDHPSYAG